MNTSPHEPILLSLWQRLSKGRPVGLALHIFVVALFVGAQVATSASAAPPEAPDTRSIQERVKTLEAYVNQPVPPAPGAEATAAPSTTQSIAPSQEVVQAIVMVVMASGGLALFYRAAARGKTIGNVCASFLSCTAIVIILWWAAGYSLAFGKNFHSPLIGGTDAIFMDQVRAAPNTDYAAFSSHYLFALHQAIYAILGAAIIALFASGTAYVCVNYFTTAPGFEIAREVFAIHGAGSAVGVVLTGVLADASVNSNLTRLSRPEDALGISGRAFDHPFLLPQLGAVLVTLLVATAGSVVIALALKALLKQQRTPESASAPT